MATGKQKKTQDGTGVPSSPLKAHPLTPSHQASSCKSSKLPSSSRLETELSTPEHLDGILDRKPQQPLHGEGYVPTVLAFGRQGSQPSVTWQCSCPSGHQHDFPLAEPKWKAKSRRAGDADCSCQSQDRWQAPSRVSRLLGRVLKAFGGGGMVVGRCLSPPLPGVSCAFFLLH